jgi:hypothetical protein
MDIDMPQVLRTSTHWYPILYYCSQFQLITSVSQFNIQSTLLVREYILLPFHPISVQILMVKRDYNLSGTI